MAVVSDQEKALSSTRRLVWIYCILWLVEGALRKWFLQRYSLQLLLIRDPLVLLIYYFAGRARVFYAMGGMLTYLLVLLPLILIQSLAQAFMGEVPWMVAAFGFRTFFLHLPLIWVVPAVFGRKEILLLGKWILYLAPPLALLMVVQFQVGPDHWLNVASTKEGAQIGSISGRIRPPAIFSFITGPIHFYAIASAIVMIGFLKKGLFPKWLLAAGVLSILAAMAVAASRSMVMAVAVVGVAGTFAAFRTRSQFIGLFGVGIAVVAAVALLARFGVIAEGVDAFQDRWSSEEKSGSGSQVMVSRFADGFLSAYAWAQRVPLFGFGSGSTSNLATAKVGFVSDVEGEWERIIYEIGPITGFLYLAFRTGLSFQMIATGLRALKNGDPVCLLFAAACFFDMLSGNIRQVTTYGYTCVVCGLCLAAFRAFSEETDSDEAVEAPLILVEKPRQRGRARFAVGGDPVRS